MFETTTQVGVGMGSIFGFNQQLGIAV